jgi:hypothetical protein
MTTVYAIHAPHSDRLEAVKTAMSVLGAPTIQVVNCGDHYMALEGSHRLAAANELGLVPNFVVFEQDEALDITAFDWFDATNWDDTVYSAGEVAGEIYAPDQARDYSF